MDERPRSVLNSSLAAGLPPRSGSAGVLVVVTQRAWWCLLPRSGSVGAGPGSLARNGLGGGCCRARVRRGRDRGRWRATGLAVAAAALGFGGGRDRIAGPQRAWCLLPRSGSAAAGDRIAGPQRAWCLLPRSGSAGAGDRIAGPQRALGCLPPRSGSGWVRSLAHDGRVGAAGLAAIALVGLAVPAAALRRGGNVAWVADPPTGLAVLAAAFGFGRAGTRPRSIRPGWRRSF
jgi:hypothetical protein